VDFLLCDQQSLRPAFGVEVIKPIARSELRAADQFIEEIFLGAGLPLVHVPSAQQYEISDLISLFQIAVTKARSAPTADSGTDSVPDCRSVEMMVLRIHRSGPDKEQDVLRVYTTARAARVVQSRDDSMAGSSALFRWPVILAGAERAKMEIIPPTARLRRYPSRFPRNWRAISKKRARPESASGV
jgi:hypothetical protein